jgi:potassium-transporting ATPase KdpC subunit
MRILGELRSSVVAVVLSTVVLGLGFPAVMTGIGQLFFEHEAQGSLIEKNGRIVGSELAAQSFTKPQYFHERPSATSPEYNAGATTFANLGPTNPDLAKAIKERVAAILKLEAPYNPGLTVHGIPVDAVTTSGSGIDPDISPAYAQLQSRRVASVRGMSPEQVTHLISDNTDERSLTFFGEPGVNVLKLNLALDKAQGK